METVGPELGGMKLELANRAELEMNGDDEELELAFVSDAELLLPGLLAGLEELYDGVPALKMELELELGLELELEPGDLVLEGIMELGLVSELKIFVLEVAGSPEIDDELEGIVLNEALELELKLELKPESRVFVT